VTWFDSARGEMEVEEAWRLLDAAVRRSGVETAVRAACGPRGLRRFILAFGQSGGRIRLGALDAQPLPRGGGPPPAAAWEAAAPDVERALASLCRLLPPAFAFQRGAIGVVRDADGRLDIHYRFDADTDHFALPGLRLPVGEPHPMEDPAWLAAAAGWEAAMGRLRGAWEVARDDESWSFGRDRIRVESVRGVVERPAALIATWSPVGEAFAWLLAEPVADEAPCVEPELALTLAEATELVAYAAARRQDRGIFQATTPEGLVLFVGLRA
jgi:hypothetical protein